IGKHGDIILTNLAISPRSATRLLQESPPELSLGFRGREGRQTCLRSLRLKRQKSSGSRRNMAQQRRREDEAAAVSQDLVTRNPFPSRNCQFGATRRGESVA